MIYQESNEGKFTHNGVKYNLNKALKISHSRPTIKVKTADISWILGYNFVNVDGKMVCYSCRKGPDNWHEERINKADLVAPIITTKENDRIIVLDGIHRLDKAMRMGIEELPAKSLSKEDLELCLQQE